MLKTTYDNFELIVINDGSDDNTETLIANFNHPKIKQLKTNSLGTARARNFGLRFAKGDILVFCDAHIAVPPDWLEIVLYHYEKINADILSIPIGTDEHSVGSFKDVGYGMFFDIQSCWLKLTVL